MKRSALNELMGKSETKDHDQNFGTEFDIDPEAVRVSFSDDGKSICLLDKIGRRLFVDIPVPKPVESGNHPAAKMLMPSSITLCPRGICWRMEIDGQIMYIDPNTWDICHHPCNH